jgi:hypothetical protein
MSQTLTAAGHGKNLLSLVAGALTSDRKSAEATYRRIVHLGDDAKDADAKALRDAMEVLGKTAEDLTADLATIHEVRHLTEFSADLEQARADEAKARADYEAHGEKAHRMHLEVEREGSRLIGLRSQASNLSSSKADALNKLKQIKKDNPGLFA